MLERVIVLICVYGSILLYDGPRLSKFADKKEKTVYILLMLVSLALAADYLITLRFDSPDIIELGDFLFGNAARAIDQWLKVPK